MTETDRIDVLHVDDDPDFADLTAEFLTQADDRLRVHTETRPEDGLDRLAADAIDCVVSDYDMPGWTGIEFLEAARERHPDLPFILYTGKGSETVASEAISAGVTDYLQKGTGTDQYDILANRIRNAVSARRATADARKRSHRLEQIVKTVPSCVVQLDHDGQFVFANDRAVEVLGLTESALTDRTYSDPEWKITDVDGDPIPESDLPFRRVRDSGEPLYDYRHTIEWPDGTRKTLSVNGAPLFDPDGDVESVVFSLSDITAQVERERDLEETTTRLAALFENSPDMIDIHSEDGTVIDVNRRFCEAFDQPKSELVGRKVWDIDRTVDPAEIRETWAGMDPGDRHELETEFVRADGERFPVEVHLTRLPRDGDEERFMVISRDTTERKRRERDLKRYRRMVDAMSETACIYDAEGRYVVVNDRLARMYDATPEELVGQRSDFLAEVRARADGDPFRALLDGDREEYRGELDSEFGTYGRATVEYRFTPLVVDGTVEGVVSVTRDTTARKRRERDLKRYRRMVNAMGESACIYDEQGRFVVVNDYLTRMYDTTAEELEGRESRFLAEVRAGADGDPVRDLLDGDREEVRGEHEFDFDTGEDRVIEYRFTPLVADGTPEAIVGIGRDITERAHRERALERARTEYEQLIDGMNDAAWVIDPDGSFVAVNDAAAETTGYTRSELLSMGITDIDTTVDEIDASRLEDDNYDDGTRVFETVHETKDGDRIPVEVSSSIVSYRGETAELGIARDITERKRRERRLEEFASVVSHDLRNPLNVAQGSVELARAEHPSEHLDRVDRAHTRMQELIDDLLALARRGDDATEVEPVDLEPFFETCWEHVETGGATLRVAADRTIRAERGRLRQLAENLLRNSVEHGSTGPRPDARGDSVEHGSTGNRAESDDAADHGTELTLTVGTLPEGFYVADDGQGIPDDERDRVFEAGYSTSPSGTGFGLRIVTRIADDHGWDVRLTDGVDGGARFEFTGVEFAD